MKREQMKGVQQLLKVADKVLSELEKKIFEGAGFNVFRLCGIDHYEISHSKIIAEFLNPKGSHGQGTLFLNLFCEKILKSLGFNGSFTERASVTTEITEYIKNKCAGRFDILIEDGSTSSVCIIENKIFAGEHSGQLERYAKWLELQRSDWKNRILVFLTLNGREAWSIQDQSRYQRLAYNSQDEKPGLNNWIDSCVEAIRGENKDAIQFALEQYKLHIINLTEGELAMSDAIVKAMKGRMECAEIIYSNYERMKELIETEFFQEIGEQLSSSGWRIRSEEDVWTGLTAKGKEGERGWGWQVQKGKYSGWVRVFIGGKCQVGIYLPDFELKKTQTAFLKWLKGNKDKLEEEGWWIFENEDRYPLGRDVQVEGSEILWDAKFYDRIVNEPEYRVRVKNAIKELVENLRTMLISFFDSLN